MTVTVTSIAGTDQAALNDGVYKCGRTTGLTEGTVDDVTAIIVV